MVPTTASSRATQAQIFFCSSNATVPAEASSQKFTIQKNGNFVNQVIDLSSASYWGGSVLGMRFDYFCDASSGDVCYLGSVTFCKTQEDVEAAIK